LNSHAESGHVARYLIQPLLLECDSLGRVIWMSKNARTLLGDSPMLADAFTVSQGGPESRLWHVWTAREHIVIAVQPLEPGEDFSGGLDAVHAALLGHLFRLFLMERRLFLRTRPRRRGAGRKAIRQIEMERRRLGRELHTGVGQALAAIRLQLELIAVSLPAPPPAVQEALERIGTLASDTLDQVRSISRRLHPPEWQRLALEDAIRQLWEISGVTSRFEATLELDRLGIQPDLEIKVLLYRAMQEALSNLVRHSQATRVGAALQLAGQRITLTVRDNGVGFDAGRLLHGPVEISGGIGLRSIREQAEVLGGKMIVESSPSGTKLVVSVPVSPGEE
jgi:signal transduction histidine kinase